jgi:hypothetical protein
MRFGSKDSAELPEINPLEVGQPEVVNGMIEVEPVNEPNNPFWFIHRNPLKTKVPADRSLRAPQGRTLWVD